MEIDPVFATAPPAMLLAILGRPAIDRLDRRLSPEGISMRHLGALGYLAVHPGINYTGLARASRVTVQSIQATVQYLEDAGLVERVTPGGRGRSASLHVTDRGKQVLRGAARVLDEVTQELLAPLDAETREVFVGALRVVAQHTFSTSRVLIPNPYTATPEPPATRAASAARKAPSTARKAPATSRKAPATSRKAPAAAHKSAAAGAPKAAKRPAASKSVAAKPAPARRTRST